MESSSKRKRETNETEEQNKRAREEETRRTLRRRPIAQITDLDEEEEEEEKRKKKEERGGGGGGEEEEEEEEEGKRYAFGHVPGSSNPNLDGKRVLCPYLDTINRNVLDFDFEKLCSVTMENLNVYACLVCGKYFQGRGTRTQAHYHSLQADHHIFVNLHTNLFYCLPENYQVVDSSLADIQHILNPQFSEKTIASLDKNSKYTRCLDGTRYLPGVMGLNNIKNNDAMSVIFQALIQVRPLRNFLLDTKNTAKYAQESPLVYHFSELARRMWSGGRFRPHVSPHEILQAVATSSKKKFRIGEICDPIDFLLWFLNALHVDLGGTRKPNSSIIHRVFQGGMNMTVYKKKKIIRGKEESGGEEWEETSSSPNFLYLPLDVPASPLFKNEAEKNIIPQLPLLTLLEKYNGINEEMVARSGERRTYKLKKLPQYLILHIKRFTKNFFFVEKNHTIVHFPVSNLELKDFVDPEFLDQNQSTKYNLVANLRHIGDDLINGHCVVDIQQRSTGNWYEMDDLEVKETIPQLITLSESYLQVWELISPSSAGK